MRVIILLISIFSVQVEVESFETERNKALFEKLHSQNQMLWNFISRKKKSEQSKSDKFIKPSELRISYVSPSVSNNSKPIKATNNSTIKVTKGLSNNGIVKKSFRDYLKYDPADEDLNPDNTGQFGQSLRPKGWQSDDQFDVNNSSLKSSTNAPVESQKSTEKITIQSKKILPGAEKSSYKNPKRRSNALQRAWDSLVNVAKSMGRPKPLSKESQRRNFKIWSFQIGLRNLINNDSDGFRHDAEVYHQLGYRIDDRQKLFVERKGVTMTGDGFGKVTRTGIGYQHYLKSVNEESDFYPYFALFYDHWKGNFNNFNGVPVVNNKSSRDILTTRLGFELPLTNTTNLDVYWERGKKFLNFTDTLGTKIEVHARNNLYGMGLSHSF
tara:strand:- start:272 stop:1420 length:1149 start_codon:yes stop_codon:yes gene_type:complete